MRCNSALSTPRYPAAPLQFLPDLDKSAPIVDLGPPYQRTSGDEGTVRASKGTQCNDREAKPYTLERRVFQGETVFGQALPESGPPQHWCHFPPPRKTHS